MQPTSRDFGKSFKDIYGRQIGQVVGVAFDAEGQIRSVGVEESTGKFAEYSGKRVVRTELEYLVVPEWKVEAWKLPKEYEAYQRKLKAVEELAKTGDFTEELMGELRSQLNHSRPSHESLAELTRARHGELEHDNSALADYLMEAKLELKCSEIDEPTFKFTSSYTRTAIEINKKEEEELRAVIGYIENIERGDEPRTPFFAVPEPTPAPIQAPIPVLAPIEFVQVVSPSPIAEVFAPESVPAPAQQVVPTPVYVESTKEFPTLRVSLKSAQRKKSKK